ncbi:hypothetical protein H0H87_001187 [Tephrocybe sp. NHM501043]|nr:hypothetical protein H0H87_001187 [Tephrocybe sp. NHM501043]
MAPGASSTEMPPLESNGDVHTSLPKTQPSKSKSVSPPANKPAPKPTLSSRSSKPIINWFQRKLAGTGRSKRTENHRAAAEAIALSKARAGSTSLSSRPTPRIASSPVTSSTYPSGRLGRHDSNVIAPHRRTMSLNGDEEYSVDGGDDNSLGESSLARESTWSPTSVLEADDDASLRPIPPSAPPSPSPPRSSSSYLSDPRTFRSIAASTKPTTLLSIDINGNGMAHIAQAPTTPPVYVNRLPPHMRNSSIGTYGIHGSATSITFSSLPQSSSRPSSVSNSGTHLAMPHGHAALQAPLHTTHHPRNNPRPSSPPLDNASVLTLASSAYAIPGTRMNIGQSTNASARGVGDSLSHFGGSINYGDVESTSQFVLGDDDRLEERDVDASVRALRPRSSRRGSWESEASRWSARVQNGGSSLARDRSLRTSNSFKTGLLNADNTESYDRSDDVDDENVDEPSPVTGVSIESPSFTEEPRPLTDPLSRTSDDISDRKASTDTVEPVVAHAHGPKDHTQSVRFSADIDDHAGLDKKKDDLLGIPHGHISDTA